MIKASEVEIVSGGFTVEGVSYRTHKPIGEVGLGLLQGDPVLSTFMKNKRGEIVLNPDQKRAALWARTLGLINQNSRL